jgi:hypothetical protein
MLRHSCGYKLANDGVDTRIPMSLRGRNSAVTPGSLPGFAEIDSVGRETHQNAIRSIDATPVHQASRLCRRDRATCSMYATGVDVGVRGLRSQTTALRSRGTLLLYRFHMLAVPNC